MKRILLLSVFIFTCIVLSTAAIDVQSLYKKFRDIDTKELMKMGTHYDLANQPDSALVCYSLVNERFTDTRHSKEENKIYCRAMTNLGFLYGSYYFDYYKAMSFFHKSNEVSESIGYTSNIAYNYLNMAGVYLSCNQIYRNQLFEDEVWEYSLLGINAALESKEWEVALACMVNTGMLNLQNPQPEKFSEVVTKIGAAPNFRG